MLDRPGVAIDLESRRVSRAVDAIFAHQLRAPGDSRDRLKQQCEARLAAAQARIEKIQLGRDGEPAGTVPFDGG